MGSEGISNERPDTWYGAQSTGPAEHHTESGLYPREVRYDRVFILSVLMTLGTVRTID